MSFNLNEAERFLTCLSQCDEGAFTFQTFTDRKGDQGQGDKLVRVLHGQFSDHSKSLCDLNQGGAGVFATINLTDGKGRKVNNIVKVRAFFVDLDGALPEPVFSAPITPHIIIESSPQHYHAYWIIENATIDTFERIQKSLAQRFQSDPKVCDLPRVMRLPGFFHQKGTPCLTKIIHESGEQPVSIEQFCEAFNIDLTHQSDSTTAHNPVLEALQKRGMIIQKQAHPVGCWTIRCPWAQLHSTQDLGTKYYEPNTNGYGEHGFQCFHEHCKGKNIHDLKTHLGLNQSQTTPLPLQRSIAHPEPYPFDHLGEILGGAARAMYRSIRAPDAICAQSVLAAAALAAQPHANIIIDGREIPLSSFFLTIGESGDRKTAADKIALKPVYMWQKLLFDTYRNEYSQFEREKESWEVRKKEWFKKNKVMPFPETSPQDPLSPLLVVDEPTYEGIVKYLAVGQPSIGLFSDEGGRFFGGYAMNNDNALKTTAGLSSLWDGKSISRMRAGDGNLILYGRRFGLHLMVQELILTQLMGNSLIEVQGFLPRCLTTFPASMAGRRPYLEENLSNDPEIQRYWEALTRLLDCKLPVKPPPAPQNELYPRALTLSSESKSLWITYHDQVDLDLAEGKPYHPIRRFASKAAEHVLRIAGVLTLIHDPNASTIEAPFITMACGLIDYYLRERLRIQNYISIDPSLACADRLLKWWWGRGKTVVGLTEIYQYGPPDIRQAQKARSIMKILVEHGHATSEKNIEIDGVKHKEAWKINPQKSE